MYRITRLTPKIIQKIHQIDKMYTVEIITKQIEEIKLILAEKSLKGEATEMYEVMIKTRLWHIACYNNPHADIWDLLRSIFSRKESI